ncbi:MAG: SPOR domain-containing protein [Thermodesulfobacteriota bacterium]|nr:SPOR domain-containing protein [Thermodesulfobacteriota bacterium]
MAVGKRKKKKWTIRFELGIGGLLGLGILCFCIFLWMFLLGIWAGQTVLQPSIDLGSALPFSKIRDSLPPKLRGDSGKGAEVRFSPPVDRVLESAVSTNKVPSIFSLQVGAFSDIGRAKKVAANWLAKEYEAFFLAPEGPDDSYYRVLIGKFDKLADANAEAVRLENDESTQVYITLVPTSKIRIP